MAASSTLLRQVPPVTFSATLSKSAHAAADSQFLSPVGPRSVARNAVRRSGFLGTSVPVTAGPINAKQAEKAKPQRLSIEANVFKRAKRVVQSYTTAVKSSIEDPERMLDESMRDLDGERQKVRETLKQVQFSITQLEGRGKQAALRAQEWHGRAKTALEKGHEDLAREALRNEKEYEESVASLESQWKQQSVLYSKLESSAGMLEEKIEEARAKRNALAARAQTATANRRVQEILGGLSTGGAVAKFEEVKEKVSKLEAEAEALADIAGESLEARFRNLERSNMDRELTQLRSEVKTDPNQKNEVTFKERLALPDFLNLKRQSEEAGKSSKDFEVIDADELEQRFRQPPVLASTKTGADVSKRTENQPWWSGAEAGRERWGDYGQPSTSGSNTTWGDVNTPWGDVSRRRDGSMTPMFPWQRVAALALQVAFGFLVFGGGLGGRPGSDSYGPGLPGGVVLGGPFMTRGGVVVRRVPSPFGGGAFDPLGQMRPYGGPMMRGPMTRGGMTYRRIVIR